MRFLACMLGILVVATSSAAIEPEPRYVYPAVLVRSGLDTVITIDGDLRDWRGIGAKKQAMDYVISGIYGLCEPSSKADFSGWFKCVLDPDHIYLAVFAQVG